MKMHLLIIDPQKDFCDPNGSLFVPGADEDAKRLGGVIHRLRSKWDDIHVTMDSHQKMDISHPLWWRDRSGAHPGPFTLISAADVESGVWTTSVPGAYNRSLDYLRKLEASTRNGKPRYPHTIWPVHCETGTEGWTVHPEVMGALGEWCESEFAMIDYVTKGTNPWTEHFSGLKAEVPDPNDPTTQLNTRLMDTLEAADIIVVAGWADTHCLMSTVEDINDAFSNPEYIKKMVLLTDCTSSVPDPPAVPGLFSNKVAEFRADMKAKGMKFATSADFLV